MLAEPRAPQPPRRVWRDWALVGIIVLAVAIEGLVRPDLVWRPVSVVVGLAVAVSMLWRRTEPLLVAGGVFATLALLNTIAIVVGVEWEGLSAGAGALILPYSLFRWASGREAAFGLALMALAFISGVVVDASTLGEMIGGALFLLFPAELGAVVRYQAKLRLRDIDEAKLLEREQLARELHDSVAHHVSAIAIQAQAGRTLAPTHPEAAGNALEAIEEAASRALTEMRRIVGALRQSEEPDLAPPPTVADIERLAGTNGTGPRVIVELSGQLDDLQPSVEAAIYRMAQESVTNAVRHARDATRVTVSVSGDDDVIRLTVTDDGETGSLAAASPQGFGLAGMTERAALLGGTVEAGPRPDRGWTVDATLPRNGPGP